MKTKALTLIETIITLAIVMILTSLSGLAVKTITDSCKATCSVGVIDSLLILGNSTARKEGNYAGVYFYDQNETLYTMDVIALYDYNTPYTIRLGPDGSKIKEYAIRLNRLDGSEIKEIGSRGDVNEAVILFSPSGRLVIKDIMIDGYRSNSSRKLNINGKDYYINSYMGNLINYP